MSIVYILYLVYIPYAREYIELKSDNNVRFDFNYGEGFGFELNLQCRTCNFHFNYPLLNRQVLFK